MKLYLKDKKYTALSNAAQNVNEYVTLHKLFRTKGDSNGPKRRQDNAKHVVYVKGVSKKSELFYCMMIV